LIEPKCIDAKEAPGLEMWSENPALCHSQVVKPQGLPVTSAAMVSVMAAVMSSAAE
jgi:hypothetical protein